MICLPAQVSNSKRTNPDENVAARRDTKVSSLERASKNKHTHLHIHTFLDLLSVPSGKVIGLKLKRVLLFGENEQ